MKTWKQVNDIYSAYLQNNVRSPKLRLNALTKIEQYLKEQYPSLLNGFTDFIHIDKFELRDKYEIWKGKKINGAESQIFNDFYKLYHL